MKYAMIAVFLLTFVFGVIKSCSDKTSDDTTKTIFILVLSAFAAVFTFLH